MNRTDLFLFESGFARDTYERVVGKPSGLVRCVFNGVGANEFDPVPLAEDATDLVYVGEFRHIKGADLLIPLKSGEGRYVASDQVLDELEGEGRVVFRYRDNPNGSQRNIAGISSANGRVVGLMPHPEHATEALTGPSDDGLGLFYSALDAVLTPA